MQAVPQIIRQLKAQGYRFVTVHELLKLEQAP
jgi:peptidoglycan/xylan/chitin deacetylase (PgdA/CDA1 family)